METNVANGSINGSINGSLDMPSNLSMNGELDGGKQKDSLKVKNVRSKSRSPTSSPDRDGRRDSGRGASPDRDARRDSGRGASPGRIPRGSRDASPGLSRTMRESLSVDLSKYIDKEDVKWLVWLAEANISKVGECQENHSTASFINVMEKVYGKVNLSRHMQVLLGAVGKPEAAEKIGETRAAVLGVKKQRQNASDEITLTLKLRASLPQILRRRNEIENDLRDVVDDDDADVNWENVSFGGATIRFKMAPSYRQRIEMLQDEEWRELGGLTILKYQFQGDEVKTVVKDDRQTDSQVFVSTKYDKRKHKSEAQLLGVVLARNGVRVLDPLYRQLEVWEDGSFADAFVDAEAEAKFDLVCADDVEDAESVSSFNDKGVPVVLISFDKENTDTQSSRLIYHLPWMFTMLIEKLKRKAPPPITPKVVDIPVIIQTPDLLQSVVVAAQTQREVSSIPITKPDVNDNVETPSDDVNVEASTDNVNYEETPSDDVNGVENGVGEWSRIDDDDDDDDDVVAPSTEGSARGVTSAYLHMDNSKRNSSQEDSADLLDEAQAGKPDDAGIESSGETLPSAVEVAEDSVADFKTDDAQMKLLGNEPASIHSSTTDDFDDAKDMLNWTMHKVILIGDSSVGKTSILSRFSDQIFNSNFISTVGIDFKVKKVKRDKRKVKLQIWDTAGQERYRTITAAFYRGTSAFIVVYDVTQMVTFVNVKSWLNQISANTDLGGHVIVLIGNKADLEESRQVPKEAAQQLAKELDIQYFETSAKTGDNVEELFHYVADVLPTEDEEYENQATKETVQLGGEEEKMPNSRCRC